MSKPVKIRLAKDSLLEKGFVQDERDHDFFFFMHDGCKTKAWTKLSKWKNNDDIDPSMFKRMKPQLQLQRDQEVEDLLACPMSYESYVAKLRESGAIVR